MKIRYAIISRVGRRSHNEDQVRVVDHPEQQTWLGLVCDGMGGHAMGETAAETVADAVTYYWQRQTEEDLVVKARRACRAAASKLDEKAFGMHHVQMGTTLVMAAVDGSTITVAHCGDSRFYLIRDGKVLHRTRDHVDNSYGWEMVTRCFFTYKPEKAVPDITQFEVYPGDRILLCSDGLYKSMSEDTLLTGMTHGSTPEEVLTDYADLCEQYGDDNYTGILAIVG